MRDTLTKLQILWWHLHHAFGEWREYVWDHDLDDYACCSGGHGSWDVCGCGGSTIREIWVPHPAHIHANSTED